MATYRLIGRGIRLHYPVGRPEVRVMRPYDRENDVFLDSDEAPTLVEITGEEILFDLGFALRTGALVPYTPPGPAAESLPRRAGGEAADGAAESTESSQVPRHAGAPGSRKRGRR